METPLGYPPPTLVRRRSARGLTRFLMVLVTVGLAVGAYMVVSVLLAPKPSAPPAKAEQPSADAGGAGDADSKPAALPDTAAAPAEPAVAIDAPAADTAPAQPSVDARQPNRWYYVNVLGDGPGAIYSRSGGQWNFAFACTRKTHMIEFIAVGTGSPGDFEKQSMSVGKVRLMMDAAYSKDGGGTISTTLPAAHPFFNSLDGQAPLEIQLVATRKTVIPIGPDVVRLIKTCRGRA